MKHQKDHGQTLRDLVESALEQSLSRGETGRVVHGSLTGGSPSEPSAASPSDPAQRGGVAVGEVLDTHHHSYDGAGQLIEVPSVTAKQFGVVRTTDMGAGFGVSTGANEPSFTGMAPDGGGGAQRQRTTLRLLQHRCARAVNVDRL